MIKIIKHPVDKHGLREEELFRVLRGEKLVAVTSSVAEAQEVTAMLCDLTGLQYNIFPPNSQMN